MDQKESSSKLRTFLVIWFGQLISTLGSGLTGFALGVWIYTETGSTTLFAINLLAFALPNLLVSPFAGVLVDRWDRRKVMILSDTGAGLSTVAVSVLYFTGGLQVWHVFLLTAINSGFNAFQWPAYSAVTSLLPLPLAGVPHARPPRPCPPPGPAGGGGPPWCRSGKRSRRWHPRPSPGCSL